MMYDVWFLRHRVKQTELFDILDHFLPFYSLKTQKIKILKNMEKLPGDIIILHMCNINDNHIMYRSWDTKCVRQNFYHLGPFFHFYPTNPPSPPPPLTIWKIKILKKWKKTWRYYHFKHMYHTWQSYDVWFLRCWAWQTKFLFCTIFCLFTPLTTQKIKIGPQMKIIWCMVPEILSATDQFFCYFGPFFAFLPP